MQVMVPSPEDAMSCHIKPPGRKELPSLRPCQQVHVDLWGTNTPHGPQIAWGFTLICVNQAAWVAVSLGEDVAGEGAGSLAAVAMETDSYYFPYFFNFHSHFQKYS